MSHESSTLSDPFNRDSGRIEDPLHMCPKDIWYKYDNTNRAFIGYIFPSWNRWKILEPYLHIRCILFNYCDRGIDCWQAFQAFLDRTFPNLEALILSQGWSYDQRHDTIQELIDFFRTTKYKYIWINEDSNGKYSNYNCCLKNDLIHVFHHKNDCPSSFVYNDDDSGNSICDYNHSTDDLIVLSDGLGYKLKTPAKVALHLNQSDILNDTY